MRREEPPHNAASAWAAADGCSEASVPSHTDRVCLGHCASDACGFFPQAEAFLLPFFQLPSL